MRLQLFIFAALFFAFQGISSANMPDIHPTPQTIRVKNSQIAKPSAIRIMGANTADSRSVSLLETLFTKSGQKNAFPVYIGKKGDKIVQKYTKLIPNVAEGYYLLIENDKVIIAGNDARGTYYGVRTLQQILNAKELPLLEISDYPDITARGIVEGFYGTPWSLDDRISLLRFCGENKLNTYIYGPKDDPYHSSPHWRIPYPEKEAQAIKKLVSVASENHVDFVWAIHPGKDIKWTAEDRSVLVRKFEAMYELGVRAFAVFFDDISGEGTKADKQAELLNYMDNTFVKTKKDILPLILCPTEYNKSWSNIEKGYLPTLGKELNPSVNIMWTGDRVISDIDKQGLEWINEHIRRKAYIWWNFPVSDYVRDHLLLGPAYGLDTHVKQMMSGFMSNPMEHAELSKVAIYSIADYAWNIESYKPMQTWEKALKTILPNEYDAFRFFAIHNADLGPNGHRYRRDESWEFKETARQYLHNMQKKIGNAENISKVREEFSNMIFASNLLMNNKENPALINEMMPWLKQFRLLGESGLATTYLQDALLNNNKMKFNSLYKNIKLLKQEMYDNSNTYNQNPYQPGVKTGTLIVEPLIDSALIVLARDYEAKYNEKLPSLANYTPHAIYTDIKQVSQSPVRYLRKNISINPLLEVIKIPANSYMGLEMIPEQKIVRTAINIGLDEFPTWAVVQVSENGKEWTTYEGKNNNQHVWIGGATNNKYRFIRLLNSSDKEQECYLKQFEVKVE